MNLLDTEKIVLSSFLNLKRTTFKDSSETKTKLVSNKGNIPKLEGLYGFWWHGPDHYILNAERNIKVAGRKNKEEFEIHEVTWDWNLYEDYLPLYVGKSTNINKRFSQHLMIDTLEWYSDAECNSDFLLKRNTSCQFRSGFEHLFKRLDSDEKLEIMLNHIYFSFIEEPSFINRFYEEDRLIGCLRPWFNIDSER